MREAQAAHDIDNALKTLEGRRTRQLETSLHVCAHCGYCNDSCHYYLAAEEPTMVPTYKTDQLRNVWKRDHDWLGKLVPWWVGARDLDEEGLERLVDTAFGSCTMCGRCAMNCPFGVNTPLLIRTARSMLAAIGRVPEGLQATVDAHLETGNNMAVSREDFVETVEWMEEELQEELDDPNAKIPLDKKGARVMYTLNPREVKYYPLTLQAAAKIMYLAGEDWTFSTKYWDATNYGLFTGDDKAAGQIARWLGEAAIEIGAQEVVMAECGHGFVAFRWEGENWLGRRFPFEVKGFVEKMAQYVREGRFELDPSVNDQLVTYHDPCNQARKGGVVDDPRYVLRRAVQNFVEMEPHGWDNYCCGGGGGMLAMTEFTPRRLEAGRVKAEQIRATGAKVVATTCHNCVDQLTELSRHYDLGVEVKNLCLLLSDAIVH